LSSWCYGNDGIPAARLNFLYAKSIPLTADTIPATKTGETTTTETTVSAIKEVPKAKKQAAPVAIAAKPIKVIKPKIIKPVIKIK
jgi:hypothetical protein